MEQDENDGAAGQHGGRPAHDRGAACTRTLGALDRYWRTIARDRLRRSLQDAKLNGGQLNAVVRFVEAEFLRMTGDVRREPLDPPRTARPIAPHSDKGPVVRPR